MVYNEKLPTIGENPTAGSLLFCLESYPNFRTVLHGEADVILAVDRNEFH